MKVLLLFSAFTLILVSITAPVARADYERTKWGMPLKKVKSIYPGGYALHLQNGNIMYSVVKQVAGNLTGYLSFTISKDSGLESVLILFPEQGTEVNLKKGIYSQASLAEGRSVFQLLKTALILKYGQTDALSKADHLVWVPDNGDAIYLAIDANETDTSRATVAVHYSKVPTMKQISTGL